MLGLVLLVVEAVLPFGSKLPFRLGQLPGEIVIKRDNFTLFFLSPPVFCLAWCCR